VLLLAGAGSMVQGGSGPLWIDGVTVSGEIVTVGAVNAAEKNLMDTVRPQARRVDRGTVPVVVRILSGGLSAFVAPTVPPDPIVIPWGVVLDDGVPF
jgi:hypothetical protein